MNRSLLTAALIAASTFVPPVALGLPSNDWPSASQDEAVDAYADLSEEYDLAVNSWKRDVRSAEDAKSRRAIRAAHPAREFLPLFSNLGEKGNGRALLWVIENLGDTGGTSAVRAALRVKAYDRLIGEHVPGALLTDACAALFGDRKLLRQIGIDGVEGYAGRIIKAVDDPVQRATVRYGLARVLVRSRVQGESERAAKLLDELVAQHPDTAWADAARPLPASSAP